MSMIRPFRGLRVAPERAADVSAVPYDVVDTEEARELAAGHPDSFLHVSKAEIDFPATTDPHAPEVHVAARAHLDRLIDADLLRRDASPSLYLYRVVMGAHEQTGIVAAASIHAYLDGRIKLHEHTRSDKVDDRARHADALDAHTGTLFLAYRADAGIDSMVERLCQAPPVCDFEAEDGTRHALWVVEGDEVNALAAAVNALPALYMADGHHRSAAAARLYEWRGERRERGEDVAPADEFLAVLFPHDRVQILPYNRVVSTLGGHAPEALVEALGAAFEVESSATPVQPSSAGEFGLYLAGGWHRLRIRPELVPDDVLGRLDINLLQQHCLSPLLGLGDQRTDSRIDFVGGIRGTDELQRLVDSGAVQAAFSLYPTQLADVLDVSDRGEIMPPKSTWFEPKLRDGLVVLPFD